jgi:hypothetical protein
MNILQNCKNLTYKAGIIELSTVVEHLPHRPEVKGLSSAAGTPNSAKLHTNVKLVCKRLSGTEECQLGRKSCNKVGNCCF